MFKYLQIVTILLYTVCSFGIILPALFSAANTGLVLAGIVWLILMVPGLHWMITTTYNQFFPKDEGSFDE